MAPSRANASVHITCILAMLLARCFCAPDLPLFDDMVVFGDSLSDDATHGAWQLSGEKWPSDPAYADHRFSNGPVWAEYVAHHFELRLIDYACGGATSDNDLVQGKTGAAGEYKSPALVEQVDAYVERYAAHSQHAHRTLFCVLIGSNDIYFNPEVHAYQVTEKVEVAIQRLKARGAFAFIIGVPSSLSISPYGTSTVAPDAELIHRYDAFASELRRDLTRLRIRLASNEFRLRVAILDIHALFNRIIARPEAFNLEADLVRKPCLTGTYGDTTPRSVCEDPEKYLWWDLFHPSRLGHELIAKDAQSVIRRHLSRVG